MELFQILLLVAVLISFLIFFVIMGLWQWSLAVTRAPFIGISAGAIPAIVDALAMVPGAVVYDLGCGDGRVLLAAQQREPLARYVGLDKAIFPIWCARWLSKKNQGCTLPDFRRANFFTADLTSATHLFTYLFPVVMDDLLPVLEQQLRPGTRLVSCDFPFAKKTACEIIEIPPHQGLGSRLYVYQF